MTMYRTSMMSTPVVILNAPRLMIWPVHSSRLPGLGVRVWPLAYLRPAAVNTPSVPRVAMNGGTWNRVTSTPLMPPQIRPMTSPMIRASTTGTPELSASPAMTIWARIMTAPTDRSIPAVRMMMVWPRASSPITVTCWSMIDRLARAKNLVLISPKITTARMSTISGPSDGWACSAAWNGLARRREAAGGASAVAGGVVIGSAPALALGGRGGDAGHPGLRRIRVELGAGVVEVLARLVGGLLPGLGELGDGLHAVQRHLAGELAGGGADLAVGHERQVAAAAVDGHDRYPGLARRLECLGRAFGRGLVDRVDHVDAGVLGQAGFHGGLAAGLRALGGQLARDLVRAALAAGVMTALRLLAVDVGVADRDAHALQEAVVAVDVDGDDLVGQVIEHGDVGALARQLGRFPLAVEQAGLGVVGRVGDVGRAGRDGRGVDRDHDQALLFGLVEGT